MLACLTSNKPVACDSVGFHHLKIKLLWFVLHPGSLHASMSKAVHLLRSLKGLYCQKLSVLSEPIALQNSSFHQRFFFFFFLGGVHLRRNFLSSSNRNVTPTIPRVLSSCCWSLLEKCPHAALERSCGGSKLKGLVHPAIVLGGFLLHQETSDPAGLIPVRRRCRKTDFEEQVPTGGVAPSMKRDNKVTQGQEDHKVRKYILSKLVVHLVWD